MPIHQTSPDFTLNIDETDENLVQQARCNPEAYAELYRRYAVRVYRYQLSRTGDEQDAQDLTAQTFLTALESLSSYQGQGTFAGWLFGIASHKVADHFRRRKAHLPLESADHLPAPGPWPEMVTTHHSEMDRVTRAIQAIIPERAEALILRIFGGLSAAEAGRVMGKSEGAVKMLAHRGLRDLQEQLRANQEEEG
jgi:RNA polymerase sigma-70 factor (ECF subfamily)